MQIPTLPKVALSTTSVYPESTTSAFEVASRLGFDGVELMVGIDATSADIDAVEKLRDYHQVPVLSVHAPCLIVTPHVWGTDPWGKLEGSADAAARLGADVIVVHPPFRWQSTYASGFVDGIRQLNADHDVMFTVENMYPWRTVAGSLPAYAPHWDPTDLDYDFLTLDLSHASTARRQSMDYVHAWGDRLSHLHLTDGSGSFKDEHLLPGQGDQQAWDVVTELGRNGFDGHVVLEVNSRGAGSREDRERSLGESLALTRSCLARGLELTARP